MNIGNIKNVVAAYFELTVADFVKLGEDLLLVALNSARKKGELAHDFEHTKVSVDLVVDDVSGVLLSSAVLSGTDTAVDVKSVISAGVVRDDDSGIVVPVGFSTTTTIAKDKIRRGSGNLYDDELRYPSDAQFDSCVNEKTRILQFGEKIFKYPPGNAGETTNVTMQVYRWLADYTADGNMDLFTKHGHEYLKWAAIVEVNHLYKRFVPRTEGNLSAPKPLADEALSSLIAWDEYVVEGGRS